MANGSRRLRLLAAGFLLGAGVAGVAAFLLTRDTPRLPEAALTLQVSPFPPAYGDVPTIERTRDQTYDGDTAVHALTPAGARAINKYARAVVHPVRWESGTDVWYACAVFLPHGFYAEQQGQIDLMRWDNFDLDTTTTDRGGVVVYGAPEPGRAYLIRARLHGDQDELVGPFTITEGSWHWLEVHQRYTTGNAADLSELFLDGRLVGRSAAANWYGRPVTAVRFGIVATSAAQARRLELWVDRVRIGPDRVGPLATTDS